MPTAYDPNTGLIAGASFLPLDLDPATEERSDARKAYYDPYASRPNLWVSTEQVVTQILFANAPTSADSPMSEAYDSLDGQGSSPGMHEGIFGGSTTFNVSSSALRQPRIPFRKAIQRLWDGFRHMFAKRQINSSNPGLVAVGVEYAADADTPRRTVTATQEVIVAAGALHSPQLLMLSGIGPADALQMLNITVNLHLPGVGSNLQE